ncbi:MAG TPA: HEAT repeat domain-containing protein [Gemmata sp.]|nr:HEAT repeat domain-containing protein [Gemmata sp.]
MRWSDLSPRQDLGATAWAVSLGLILLPTTLLALLALRTGSLPVAVGAGVQGLFLLVFLRAHPVWRPPIGGTVVVLYLVAVLWAWIPLHDSRDWLPPLVQGSLLLVGVVLFAAHDLIRTGAEPLRQANKWVRRITSRRQWPAQPADCRTVPEAAGLRDAIRDEPGPALALLSDPRPEVKTAALGALEYRPHWREGEAELVLKTGWESDEPAVRVAAVYALAGVGTADLVAGLADFLRDPAPEVRRATSEALMWEADARWPFAREGVREALADSNLYDDGPLFAGMGRLPAAAVADLITWSAEHPPLAGRAILTLVEHYHADLVAGERPELAAELAEMMLDNETPPALRVEIADLLREHQLLTPDLLDRLTNLDQPAPIRLFAAELMLRINPHDPDGVDVLRGLARQPNRELAVRVAAVIQIVLGLDMGLPDDDLPSPTSKQAADITRRVLAWANGASQDVLRSTPGPLPGLKGNSRHGLPGLAPRQFAPPTPPPARPAPPPDDWAPLDASEEPSRDSFLHEESSVLPDDPRLMANRPAAPEPSVEDSSLFSAGGASIEESSLFSADSAMAGGEPSVFAGEEPEEPSPFFADEDVPIGESSLLPHDERPRPPQPPPLRRPGGSSGVF